MDTIHVDQIVIPDTQRRTRQPKVLYMADKMEKEGYNISYPITLQSDGETLIDGGHRIEAAKIAGIDTLPFITTDEDPIKHAIRCNEDGTDTEAHDVFDLAELCYTLSGQGQTGREIAERLGWTSPSMVTFHKQIKERLHPKAFDVAASNFTKIQGLVKDDDVAIVKQDFTKVNWKETHLRELVSTIPYTDNASYRAQMRIIRKAHRTNKLTAKKMAEWTDTEAWHLKLGRAVIDDLVEEVPLSSRINLLRNIYDNVFGSSESKRNWNRFIESIEALNKKATGATLYYGDALEVVPTLEDDSVALAINDPPYNTTDYEWDKIGERDEYLEWTKRWLESLRPKLRPNYHLFIFCAPEYAADMENLLQDNDWPLKSRIIWEYRNLVRGRDVKDKFIVNYQMILHCGTHPLNWPPNWDDSRFAVQRFAAPQSNFKEGKDHPMQKPLGLIERFIRLGSKPGDVVLDMFAGGGITGRACQEVDERKCILIEADDDYCKVIENKLGISREKQWATG